MDKKKKSYKRSLLKNWTYSYIGVCLIPVAFFIVFAFSSSTLLNKSTENENRIALTSIQNMIDRAIEENSSLSLDILISPVVNSNLIYETTENITSQKMFETSTSIRHLLNSYRNISDAFVFSPELDKYVSSTHWGSIDDLIMRNELDIPLSVEERRNLFTDVNLKKLEILDASYVLRSGKRVERLLIMRPLTLAKSISGNALYLVSIVELGNLLPEYLGNYHNLLIVDEKEEEILFNYLGTEFEEKDKAEIINLEAGKTEKVHRDIAMARYSSWQGIKYIVLVNTATYYQHIKFLVFMAFLMFAISIVLGLLFIYIKIKKEWNDFREAIAKAGSDIDFEKIGFSRYDPFVSTAQRLQEEQTVMGSLIKRQTESLKVNMISRLIENPSLVSEDSLKECGINLISEKFVVLLLSINREGEDVSKYFEGYLFLPFPSSLGEAYIVNIPKNLKEEDFYQSFAKRIKEVIDKSNNIMAVASSNLSKGLVSVGQGYLDAINTLEYLNTILSREFMFHRDVIGMEKKTNFSYSTEDELKIESAIDRGDYSQAEELISTIIKTNKDKGIPKRSLRYLLFSIAATIVRTANKIKIHYDWTLPDIIFSSIMQSENFEDSLEEVKEGLKKLCQAIDNLRSVNLDSNEEGYEIYRKALKLIRENYQNSMVNVSWISEKTETSGAHLSKIFKKFHGINISDYLTKYRVQMAKKYLSEGKCNEDVISLCGFGSERSFFRVFKTSENITPHKYREMRKEGKDDE